MRFYQRFWDYINVSETISNIYLKHSENFLDYIFWLVFLDIIIVVSDDIFKALWDSIYKNPF